MGVARLAHVEVRTERPEAISYYTDVVGLEPAAKKDGCLYLKCGYIASGPPEIDRYSVILKPSNRNGIEHISWQVESEADLDFFEKKLCEAGYAPERVKAGHEPGQGEAVRFRDPGGFQHELVYELEHSGISKGPFKGISPQGLSHAFIRYEAPAFKRAQNLFMDTLGFKITEYVVNESDQPLALWLRRTSQAHDLAITLAEKMSSFHHFAFQLDGWHDMARAADFLYFSDNPIELGPGGHVIAGATTCT